MPRTTSFLPIAMGSLLLSGVPPLHATGLERADIAERVFFDFCIDVLEQKATFRENDLLVELGFPAEPETREHAQFKTYSAVKVGSNTKGMLVGGSEGAICTIIVTGEDRLAFRERLRKKLPSIGLKFTRDDNVESPSDQLTIETHRSILDDETFIDVSFMTVVETAENPSVNVSIYFKAR